jgi:hypothetical protein
MTRSGDGSKLRAELAAARQDLVRLRHENQQLRQQHATDSATITTLRSQLQRLEELARQQTQVLTATRQQLAAAQEQLTRDAAQLGALTEQLRAAQLAPTGSAQPPAWVKPNKPTEAKKPRRKRARTHNHGRVRDTPTQTQIHRLDACPTCQTPLERQRLRQRRLVIEVPPPAPLEITEHQIYVGWCPRCRRWHRPAPDLSSLTLGQGQIGLRLASLIATLRYQGRLPLDVVAALLASLWQVKLSVGVLVKTLTRLRVATAGAFSRLQEQARASPVLHMDETGWRENGINGYIWELATGGPMPVVVYAHDRSRAGAVMARLLGGQFQGVLVCDFYCGYNGYRGRIQRCWVHLLRALHELKQEHGADASVVEWTRQVQKLYGAGKAFVGGPRAPSEAAREAQYAALLSAAKQLGLAYAQQPDHPCHALAQRIMRHVDELFVFVLIPAVPADNNLAERRLRPLVVSRKISGGSRSAGGTETHMQLASLVHTWLARGQNPYSELLALLLQSSAAPNPQPSPVGV